MTRFGLEEDYREYVAAYRAVCLFTTCLPNESPLEFVIPDGGKLAEFHGGKGGLHHIAFEVADVESVRAEYETAGMALLEQTPVTGAGGILVNFLHPRFGEGVLVEFVQRTPTPPSGGGSVSGGGGQGGPQ